VSKTVAKTTEHTTTALVGTFSALLGVLGACLFFFFHLHAALFSVRTPIGEGAKYWAASSHFGNKLLISGPYFVEATGEGSEFAALVRTKPGPAQSLSRNRTAPSRNHTNNLLWKCWSL
jgi:hypothetical protein